jgi:hypothetical protein
MQFDLRTYLERFPEVCETKFGRTFSFRQLERRFQKLRDGERWLAAKDVMLLFDPQVTPFGRYWAAPAEKPLDHELSTRHIMLAPLPQRPGVLIQTLLEPLHSLGIVSLILRFVHPQRFGIFSTPVVDIVQVQRATAVGIYLAFCEELQEWQSNFHLESVSDTEMALWTFAEICRGSQGEEAARQAQREFAACHWAQRRRAGNVLKPFFDSYGALGLARILTDQAPKLAGKIAGEEYERLLNAASMKFYGKPISDAKGAVHALLDSMLREDRIKPGERTELRFVWETRNRAVHHRDSVSPEEVEVMIDRIERICAGWDSFPAGRE